MTRLFGFLILATLVVLATQGMAQEAAEAPPALPAVPGINGAALEDWFFNFLGKLFDLFAEFIGQILQQIFGGINGMFAGGPSVQSV